MDEPKNSTKSGFLTLGAVRDILLIVLIGVAAWKLLNADLKLDLSTFSFTDLLALLLALFSVWLSVAFYFKANEASNQFYDNTYRFSQEMSEILGRIEAGFGERLRHLDEGYSGLRERFDKLRPYENTNAADAAVKKEEEEIRIKEQEQKQLWTVLAERAKLEANEKEELFEKVAKLSKELGSARMELEHLKEFANRRTPSPPPRALIQFIARKIDDATPPGLNRSSPQSSTRQIFDLIKENLPHAAIRDLTNFGLLNSEGTLTPEAVARIRMELSRLRRADELPSDDKE